MTNTTYMEKMIHTNIKQLTDLWFAVSTTTIRSRIKKWFASIM